MEQISPKEKAIQLINSIFDITQRYLDNEKLALLIVDEILKIGTLKLKLECGYLPLIPDYIEYWQEVEFEIIKYCNEKP